MSSLVHPLEPRGLNLIELSLAGSYPIDYKYLKNETENNKAYLIGMSVPPLMIAKIAEQIKIQWLDRL